MLNRCNIEQIENIQADIIDDCAGSILKKIGRNVKIHMYCDIHGINEIGTKFKCSHFFGHIKSLKKY